MHGPSDMRRLPDGHMLYRENADAPWELRDEDPQGATFYLDRERPLNAVGAPLIPIKDGDGKEFATVTDASTLLVLSHEFSWPILTGRGEYVAIKQERSNAHAA